MERVVLVTGAAGAIGARLLPALRAAGWRTRALVHRRPAEGADEQVPGDLGHAGSLQAATAGVGAVLHVAARTHARRDRDYRIVNAEGTARLVDAARAAAVERFVHVSTRAVSPHGGGYSRSKREAEELVRSAGLEHVIVRLPEFTGRAEGRASTRCWLGPAGGPAFRWSGADQSTCAPCTSTTSQGRWWRLSPSPSPPGGPTRSPAHASRPARLRGHAPRRAAAGPGWSACPFP